MLLFAKTERETLANNRSLYMTLVSAEVLWSGGTSSDLFKENCESEAEVGLLLVHTGEVWRPFLSSPLGVGLCGGHPRPWTVS